MAQRLVRSQCNRRNRGARHSLETARRLTTAAYPVAGFGRPHGSVPASPSGWRQLDWWIGGGEWRGQQSLHRLFAEAEPGEPADQKEPVPTQAPAVQEKPADTGVGPAPAETVALWVERVGSMGRDEIDDFERRTSAVWDRASLGALRRAIERRRRGLPG